MIDELVELQLHLASLVQMAARNGNIGLAFKLTYMWQWIDREIKEMR